MNPNVLMLVAGGVGAVVAALVVSFISSKKFSQKQAEGLESARKEFDERIRQMEAASEKELDRRMKEAEVAQKAEILRQREDIERENRSRVEEIQKMEQRILQREETLDKRRESLDSKEGALAQREHVLRAGDIGAGELLVRSGPVQRSDIGEAQRVAVAPMAPQNAAEQTGGAGDENEWWGHAWALGACE